MLLRMRKLQLVRCTAIPNAMECYEVPEVVAQLRWALGNADRGGRFRPVWGHRSSTVTIPPPRPAPALASRVACEAMRHQAGAPVPKQLAAALPAAGLAAATNSVAVRCATAAQRVRAGRPFTGSLMRPLPPSSPATTARYLFCTLLQAPPPAALRHASHAAPGDSAVRGTRVIARASRSSCLDLHSSLLTQGSDSQDMPLRTMHQDYQSASSDCDGAQNQFSHSASRNR